MATVGASQDEVLTPEALEQEKEHFQKVLNAFLYYRWAGLTRVGAIAYALFISTQLATMGNHSYSVT